MKCPSCGGEIGDPKDHGQGVCTKNEPENDKLRTEGRMSDQDYEKSYLDHYLRTADDLELDDINY